MPILKQSRALYWTSHSKAKMRFYGLSAPRVRRVLHSPARVEHGIASGTIAYMQRAGSTKHPHELWVMVEDAKDRRNVVSAWRYPGVTKPGEKLPEAIMRELREVA